MNPAYALKKEQQKYKKNNKYFLTGREKTFSNFIYYRLFYGQDKPTFLCEGKTDNIYLKSTINELAVNYPKLAIAKTNARSYKLLVHFVKYSKRTNFLLELNGGVNYLKDFIQNFSRQYDFYKSPRPEHPVIIILDNDKGLKDGFQSSVSSIPSTKLFPTILDKNKYFKKADFIHVMNNLYIVLTPLSPTDEDTDIESLFDDATRLKQYNGKCFNTVDNRDEKKDLSKNSFANHIIKAQKSSINFDGFEPLLSRVVDAITHYDSIKNR